MIFRGDLISQIGVEMEIFEKGRNLEIKLFQENQQNFLSNQLIRLYFGIERGENVLQYQKLNLGFDGVQLKFCSQK